MSFRGAPSLGSGSMIGAGIFALFAATGAVAGAATWIAFLAGGIMAALLVRATRSSSARGGVVASLIEGLGAGRIAGVASWIVYAATVVTVLGALAGVFGTYAAALAGGGSRLFATGLVVGVVALCWASAAPGRLAWLLASAFVLVALAGLAAATLSDVDASKLAPGTYPPVGSIAAAVGLACFAYLAFAGAAGRTGTGATVLYVLVSLGVFGTLTVAQVERHGVTALAEAARPALGDAGFTAVAVAALGATAAAAYTTLRASSALTGALAEAGLFPAFFAAERIALPATGGVALAAATVFSPSAIAAVGSALALIVFLLAGLAVWLRRRETLASSRRLVLAITTTAAVLGLFARETWQAAPATFTGIVLVVVLAFVLDYWVSVQDPRDDVPRGFRAAHES